MSLRRRSVSGSGIFGWSSLLLVDELEDDVDADVGELDEEVLLMGTVKTNIDYFVENSIRGRRASAG